MAQACEQNDSPVHRTDARVKVISTLAFIFFLNMTPHRAWAVYILFLSLLFSVILLARVAIWAVIRRTLPVTPFILAALPLIFNGPPLLVSIPMIGAVELTYSPEGLGRFVSIFIKTWLSVTATIVLTSTTPFLDILTALRYYKAPNLLIAIFRLMWRYLFVIREEAQRLLRALENRNAIAIGNLPAGRTLFWRAKVAGNMVGSLFLRSLERSDRIYAAMLSRGHNGQLLTLETAPLSPRQSCLLKFILCLLAFLWGGSLLIGG